MTASETMPGESPSLLTLEDVSKTYHAGDVNVPVLHNVDLELRRREMTVVVGPSGSGKSTLLNMIGGIDRPTSGRILFDGQEISRFSDRELTTYRRETVGFVFQFYNLVPTLTAVENVLVATEIASDSLDAREALTLVGLEDRLDHFPSQLSGGEQQRVAIARAVAKRPELLLCDEPTGSLDLSTGRLVLEVLDRLNKQPGMTVVIITHNSAITAMGHKIVRLGSGTIAETRENNNRVDPREISW